MIGHFYVHADFPSHVIDPTITHELLGYEEAIRRSIVENSQCAIRVRSIREVTDLLGIETFNTFESGTLNDAGGEVRDSGVIEDSEEVQRLANLVWEQKITDAVVHGAYLGYCVKGFAAQLLTHPSIKSIRLGIVLSHPYEELPKRKRMLQKDLSNFDVSSTQVFETGLDAFGNPMSSWL